MGRLGRCLIDFHGMLFRLFRQERLFVVVAGDGSENSDFSESRSPVTLPLGRPPWVVCIQSEVLDCNRG